MRAEEAVYIEPEPPKPTPVGASSVKCRCVQWLRETQGINIKGDADTIKPNTALEDIYPGVVILFRYDGISHAALITSLHRDEATIIEANYRPCQVGTRTVKITDPSIMGFYIPPLSTDAFE